MLKKTFLAVSVGAALGSAGAFAAPAFDYQQSLWTNEAAENVTHLAVPDIQVTMGTEYTEDDTVEFTFSVPILGTFAPSIAASVPAGAANADNFASMRLGLIDATTTTATYRVTSIIAAQAAGAAAAATCNGVVVAGLEPGDDCPIITTGATFVLTDAGTAPADNLRIVNNAPVGLTGTYAALTQNGDALDGTATPVPFLDRQANGSATAATAADDTVNLFSFAAQYAADVSLTTQALPLDGVIDVDTLAAADRRETFVLSAAADTNTDADTLIIDFTENVAGHHAVTSKITTTITGDFSWIVDTAPLTPVVDAAAAVVTVLPAPTSTVVTANSITVVYDLAAPGNVQAGDLSATLTGGITVTLANDATNANAPATRPQLPDTAFGVSTVVEYLPLNAAYLDGNTATAAADGEAYTATILGNTAPMASAGGAWAYNGSVVDIYAVPTSFARNTPFIWVTNSNGVAGEVYGAATTESGVAVDLGELGTIAAREIKSFSTEIVDALTAAGITTGRVTLELTTSTPACGVNVSAQYYNLADNDRAALETSQTIGGVYGTGKAAGVSGGGTGSASVTDDRCSL